MIEVHVTRNFDFPAQRLWDLLADFGNINWAPGIERVELIGEGIGMIRRLHMANIPAIDEQLTERDAQQRVLAYRIPQGLPMPLEDYSVRAVVSALDDRRCSVHWRGRAVPLGVSQEEASSMLKGTYEMLLQWIAEHLQQAG